MPNLPILHIGTASPKILKAGIILKTFTHVNESEQTEEIKTFPIYLHLLQGQALLNCMPILDGRPGDVGYTTPLPHPTIRWTPW